MNVSLFNINFLEIFEKQFGFSYEEMVEAMRCYKKEMESTVYVVKSDDGHYWAGSNFVDSQIRNAKMYIWESYANKACESCNKSFAEHGEWRVVKATIKEENE